MRDALRVAENLGAARIFIPPAPTATSTGNASQCDHVHYPTVCIPPYPPDLNCDDIPYNNFTVVGSDPHGFDGNDNDGVGCET